MVVQSYSQNCNDFTLNVDQTTYCSGENTNLSAGYSNSTGAIVDTSFAWMIDGDVVNLTNSFDTVFYNYSSSSLQVDIIFKAKVEDSTCTYDSIFHLTILPVPQMQFNIKNPSCNGWNNAEIEFIFNNLNQRLYSSGGTVYTNSPINNLLAGSYSFSIEENFDGKSCSLDTSIIITEPDPFTYSSFTTVNDNCEQGTGSITFLGLSGGTKPYSFENLTSGPYINNNDSIIIGLSEGNYPVKLVDLNGCEIPLEPNGIIINTNTYNKPVEPSYEDVYEVCEEDSLTLVDTEAANSGLQHFYSFSGGLPFAVSVDEKIQLSLLQSSVDSIFVHVEGGIGSLNEGCHSEDSVLIEIIHLNCVDSLKGETIATNSFSPYGGEEENATFQIDLKYVTDETVTDVKVKIYNRWGGVIHEFENYNNGSSVWNGDNHFGESMPEGTYFYTLEVASQSFSTSGWVYLDK